MGEPHEATGIFMRRTAARRFIRVGLVAALLFAAALVPVHVGADGTWSANKPSSRSLPAGDPRGNTCSFADDFSNAGPWTQFGGGISVSGGVVNYTTNGAGSGSCTAAPRLMRPLGCTLSNVSWQAEFDIRPNASHRTAGFQVFTLSSTNADPNCGNIETISIHYRGLIPDDGMPNRIQLIATGESYSSHVDMTLGVWHYIRVERISQTEFRLNVFSDPARTSHVGGSPVSYFVAAPGPTGLAYLQYKGCNGCGPARSLNATIDNMAITDAGAPIADCNGNTIPDATDIASQTSADCNTNTIPDECEIDENSTAPGGPFFCTANCDPDCNDNGVPDDCEEDCNGNNIPDDCDISDATSSDCNGDGVPDECEPDCNGNNIADECDIDDLTSTDCNQNEIPDECDIGEQNSTDCNGNAVPDECEIDENSTAPGGPFHCTSGCDPDCNDNGIPDDCEPDCNANSTPDDCDLAGSSLDCNNNGIPDECDLSIGAGGVRFRVVALTEEAAPGTEDGEFDYFEDNPALNNAGQAAFSGEAGDGGGLWSEGSGSLAGVAIAGDPAPDTGTTFQYAYCPNINNAGQTAFTADLEPPPALGGEFYGIWSEGSGSLALVAMTGDPAPGFSGTFNNIGEPAFNDTGKVAFWASLDTLTLGQQFGGIWSDRSGSLANIAIAGDPTPGTSGTFEYFSYPTLNGVNQVAFQAYITPTALGNQIQGIWSEGSGTLELVALQHDPVPGNPGAIFDWFGSPVLNDAGQIAFNAGVTAPTQGGSAGGAWKGTTGAIVPVALHQDPAPGTSGTFSYINDVVMNGQGLVAFQAGIDEYGNSLQGVWSEGSGTLELVALEGQPAPMDPPGTLFWYFNEAAINASGQTAFQAGFTGPARGGDASLWVWTPGEGLQLIVATGDEIEVAPGDTRSVSYVEMLAYSGGEDGRPSGFNDAGEVCFIAYFDDGSEGILVGSAGPLSEDCNENNIPDECEVAASPGFPGGQCTSNCLDDCNENGIPDECESQADCNSNSLPDICEEDCNNNGVPDDCDLLDLTSADCNGNGVPDECDIAEEDSEDCNENGIPDECEIDVNSTAPGGPFHCTSDCDPDCNDNGIPDECEADCNANGVPDDCDISNTTSGDCNGSGVPDECEVASSPGFPGGNCQSGCLPDCNENGVPDECDIADATSTDCNQNDIPDECELSSGGGDLLFRTVALRGDSAPGGVGNFDEFEPPTINNLGRTAFHASIFPLPLGNQIDGVWSEGSGTLNLLGVQGGSVPDIPGATFDYFNSPIINHLNETAFQAEIESQGAQGFSQSGVWLDSGGSLSSVALRGDPAPGLYGTFEYVNRPLLSHGGETWFTGSVDEYGQSLQSVWGGSAVLQLLALASAPAPGTNANFDYFGDFGAINESSTTAFYATATSYDSYYGQIYHEGIWSGRWGSLSVVSFTGDPAPGTGENFEYLGYPDMNDAGQVAFWAQLTGLNLGGDNGGIWSEGSGSLARIAGAGDPAPGTTDTFSYFQWPIINGMGRVAFQATIDNSNQQGLWVEGGSGLELVALQGDAIPGDPSTTFQYFYGLNMNSGGTLAFVAQLTGATQGGQSPGIFLKNPGAALTVIVRPGDLIEVAPGDSRTVLTVSLHGDSGGQDGRGSSLNDMNQIAFEARFDDGSSGIFVASTSSQDCNNNGILDVCEIDENSTAPGGPFYCTENCDPDCDNNGIPDECDGITPLGDCNSNGVDDSCELLGGAADCNDNNVLDDCEVPASAGFPGGSCQSDCADDCNENGVPDECEPDCNGNDVPDDCDIADETSTDCNENDIPDDCELGGVGPRGGGGSDLVKIALTGEPAPGAGGNYVNLSTPVVNDLGRAAFGARTISETSGGQQPEGIWVQDGSSLVLLANTGDSAPGTGDTYLELSAAAFNNLGQVAFYGATSDFREGVWSGSPGLVSLLALAGDPAPGHSANIGNVNDPVFNHLGHSAFTVSLDFLTLGLSLDGMLSDVSGSPAVVLLQGDAAPGMPGFVFDYMDDPVLNSLGRMSFVASVEDGYDSFESIWSDGSGAMEVVALQGDIAPGTSFEFDGFSEPSINDAGQTVFQAWLNAPALGGGSAGIWSGVAGSLQLVALTGDPAPGTSGTFYYFQEPVINGGGRTAICAGVDVGGDTFQGIWLEGPGGLELIAFEGNPAPGAPAGILFQSFGSVTLNNAGQIAFSAQLSNLPLGGSGDGLWLHTPGSSIEPIAVPGDAIEVSPGDFRNVQYVSIHGDSGGEDGRQRGLGDQGHVAFRVEFDDGSQGVFITASRDPDCNGNDILDVCEIDENSTAPGGPFFCTENCDPDCDNNGIPDECDGGAPRGGGQVGDCNNNGQSDVCDILDGAPDCNGNGLPDECDVPSSAGFPGGTCTVDCSADCNQNGIPDECEIDENSTAPGGPFFCTTGCDSDCNGNGVPDACDAAAGLDCNGNNVPDECEIDVDCNGNGIPDVCDADQGDDCNNNNVPDECEIDENSAAPGGPFFCTTGCDPDCNGNGIPDSCDIAGASLDCNGNNVPDECEIDENSTAPGGPFFCTTGCDPDCNNNGIPDSCDPDCNGNNIPDVCEIDENSTAPGGPFFCTTGCDPDCNNNGIPDSCDIATASDDCNGNGVPDECEIDENSTAPGGPFFCTTGCDPDCNNNGVPDICDPDCNGNDVPDVCEIDENSNAPGGPFFCMTGCDPDCNNNGLPDDCDPDCNANGVPDICEVPASSGCPTGLCTSGCSDDCNENCIPDDCEGIGACCVTVSGPPDCTSTTETECSVISLCACQALGGTFLGFDTNCTQTLTVPIHTATVWSHEIVTVSNCPDPNAGSAPCVDGPFKIDPWITAQGGSGNCETFDDQINPETCPIPAGFFGPGSDPFTGEICFRGVPIGVVNIPGFPGPLDFGEADTLVRRDQDPFDRCEVPSPTEVTVNIAVERLRLISCAPISVTFNGGQAPEEWTVGIEVLTGDGQPGGTLTATKEHCNGGTFDSVLAVCPTFVFTKVEAPFTVLNLDFCNACNPSGIVMDSTDVDWVTEPGENIDVINPVCSEFLPGISENVPVLDCDCDQNGVQDVCDIEDDTSDDCNANQVPDSCEIDAGSTAPGGPYFCTSNCAADCNNNGVPDECDSCGDLDGDGDADGDDFGIILVAFGHGSGDPEFHACADYDDDGLITAVDYQEWLLCYRAFIGNPLAPPPLPGNVGDLNHDWVVDGRDIQGFVQVALDPASAGFLDRTLADINGDTKVDMADVSGFVGLLLNAD